MLQLFQELLTSFLFLFSVAFNTHMYYMWLKIMFLKYDFLLLLLPFCY